ncbi:hypothetical protein F511_34443 [Dorcoceras hygrometricum]|uniref:Uncharacterized protein n=1 Tax=Dorcoceras hygrometricum TaxID=472368 RepID=A0A2Z7CL22_9LAMI|nr:hypothetical protein F511_34443 [Dorcoceras hygrometricum]
MGGGAPLDTMAACARAASCIVRDVGLVQAPPAQSLATRWSISCVRWWLEERRCLAPLLRVTAETSRDKEARWPHVPRLLPLLVEDGRLLNARWPCDRRVLVGRCRATLAVEARCYARRRALPSRILVVVAPPAGRRSGESPAIFVTAGMNSSRVWFGPVPGSPGIFRAGMRCRARF